MSEFQQFFNSLGDKQSTIISDEYRKQFKIRGEFAYPPGKKFDQICKSFLEDEKLRTKRKWDNSFKLFLIWFLVKYFEKQNILTVRPDENDWHNIEGILRIDKHALKQRWITLINPQMKSINWSPEEDDFIRNQMNQKHKHIWTQIAVSLYERNLQGNIRTPKQIRERWMNYLNPDLNKEQWLLKEDLIILNNVIKNGKKWSQISQQLTGRTENQVKNRYYKKLLRYKSLIHKICKDDECDEVEMIKHYVRKKYLSYESSSANADSNKQGIVGKRGRHKKGMRNKEMKFEKKQQKNIPKIIKQEDQQSQQSQHSYQQQIQQPLLTQSQKLQQQFQQQQQFQIQQFQQQMNFNNEEMKLALNIQSNLEDMKNTTPLMMLHQCLTSPGYQFLENQLLKQISPGMPDEGECLINSSLQIPKFNPMYKVASPFLLPSMMQSPFWNGDLLIPQNEEQPQPSQSYTQQISTTPYLNLGYMRPQINGFQKPKELDLLQENPIQQFNKRRNINQ